MSFTRPASNSRAGIARVVAGVATVLVYLVAAPPASALSLNDVLVLVPWLALIFTIHAIMWSTLSFIAFYLLAVVFAALFLRTGYPPAVARTCCWVFYMLWLIFQFTVTYPIFLHVLFPIWLYVTVFLFGIGLGVLLMVSRPRANYAR
jgi:hypothetical protein